MSDFGTTHIGPTARSADRQRAYDARMQAARLQATRQQAIKADGAGVKASSVQKPRTVTKASNLSTDPGLGPTVTSLQLFVQKQADIQNQSNQNMGEFLMTLNGRMDVVEGDVTTIKADMKTKADKSDITDLQLQIDVRDGETKTDISNLQRQMVDRDGETKADISNLQLQIDALSSFQQGGVAQGSTEQGGVAQGGTNDYMTMLQVVSDAVATGKALSEATLQAFILAMQDGDQGLVCKAILVTMSSKYGVVIEDADDWDQLTDKEQCNEYLLFLESIGFERVPGFSKFHINNVPHVKIAKKHNSLAQLKRRLKAYTTWSFSGRF